MQACL